MSEKTVNFYNCVNVILIKFATDETVLIATYDRDQVLTMLKMSTLSSCVLLLISIGLKHFLNAYLETVCPTRTFFIDDGKDSLYWPNII